MSSFVRRRSVLRFATGGGAIALTGPGFAVMASRQAVAEQDPAGQLVQRAANQAIEVAEANAGAAREAGIRRVLEAYFDLAYMGRSTLGSYWNQATPDQRERFLKVAANAEAHAYARRFGQYGGQTLTVAPSMPKVRGDGVSIVNSTLTQTNDEPLAIQWEVHNAGQGARIVDVRIGGVSMVVTRRAEYNSFIQAQGGKVEPLITELEARAKR